MFVKYIYVCGSWPQQWVLYRVKEVLHVVVYQASVFSDCISWLFCVAVSDGARTSLSSRCATQSLEDLKRREANSWSYCLKIITCYLWYKLRVKLSLVFCWVLYKHGTKDCPHLNLMQVSNAKSMASNRGLWGDKGIILMETDKLCSHRLTCLYHRNGEAAKQSHFNQV